MSEAGIILKRYWRGYIYRLKVTKMRDDELHFLGIKKSSEDPK